MDYRKTMSTPQTQTPPQRENEFGMATLPTFSPFNISSIKAVARKIKTGARAGQEFNMYEVEIIPKNYVGKKAIFTFNKTTLDRLRAVRYLAGNDASIECSWSETQNAPIFSAQLNH